MRASPVRAALASAVGVAARALALPLLLLVAWEVFAHSARANPVFVPALERIVDRAVREICEGSYLDSLLASLERDLVGFVAGSAAGTATGLLVGLSAPVERLLSPMLQAFRQIALFAWVPLLSLWFGGGEAGKIAFIALAAFQPSLVNTWRGVAAIPRQYRELADTWTYGPADYVRFVALPAALPSIFAGLHAALIYGWSATVGAELLLDIAPGLGSRMSEGQQLFHMDLLLLCLVTLGTVGLALNILAVAAERRLLRWRAP